MGCVSQECTGEASGTRAEVTRDALPEFRQRTVLADEELRLIAPDAYAAEWKWDGIRVQAVREGDVARLYSRTGDDVSRAFPDLVEALDFAGAVDGVLLVIKLGESGRDDLRRALKLLGTLRSKVIGVVITNAPRPSDKYDYYATEPPAPTPAVDPLGPEVAAGDQRRPIGPRREGQALLAPAREHDGGRGGAIRGERAIIRVEQEEGQLPVLRQQLAVYKSTLPRRSSARPAASVTKSTASVSGRGERALAQRGMSICLADCDIAHPVRIRDINGQGRIRVEPVDSRHDRGFDESAEDQR